MKNKAVFERWQTETTRKLMVHHSRLNFIANLQTAYTYNSGSYIYSKPAFSLKGLLHRKMCFVKFCTHVYGNCWITAWTTDGSLEASIESAVGAQVEAIHLCDQKSGSISPRPHLRADCHWGRISFWRLLPLEFFFFSCEPRTWVSIYFWLYFSSAVNLLVIQAVKYQPNPTTLLIVYLLIVCHVANTKEIHNS